MARASGSTSITGLAAAFALLGCTPEHAPAHHDAGPRAERTIELVARTPHLATYPCGAQCHDARTSDPTPRALTTFHAGRTIMHGPAIHWCDDCHDLEHLDSLVALDGETPISFDASDQLCGQCHGERHRDWEHGLHGSSTGHWRGTVTRRLCTACHDPHAPTRIQLEALPPPLPDPRTEAR